MKTYTSVVLTGFAALGQAVQLTNSDYHVQPGQPFTITWSENQGPVTLKLKSGPSDNLGTVATIASAQSGNSFSWTPPSGISSGQYAIEISDASGTPNYSPQFNLATGVSPPASPSAPGSASHAPFPTAPSSPSHSFSSPSTASASASAIASPSASPIASPSASIVKPPRVLANNNTASLTSPSSASSTHSTTLTSPTNTPVKSPTPVPGSDSVRLSSPIALIGLTVVAMLYFQ